MSAQVISKRSGFSLVELVVVVLVMGIIAAVAGPKMFDTAGNARTSSTKQSLSVLRSAIELSRAQNGTYPADKAAIEALLQGPFPAAEVATSLTSSQRIDVNVVTAGTALAVDTTPAHGWKYDSTTGEIIVNQAAYATW